MFPLSTIGKEFGVSDQTVARSLNWAETNGLIEDFEDQILKRLVPAAVTTLKEAMTGQVKDVKVALEVMKGIGLFKKHTTKPASDETRGRMKTLNPISETNGKSQDSPSPLLLSHQSLKFAFSKVSLQKLDPRIPESPERVEPAGDEDSPEDEIGDLDEPADLG
jgi:hypothetical protein